MAHPYANLAGNSGVTHVDFSVDWVEVTFKGGRVYRYTAALNGQQVIDEMRRKAVAGVGLARFILRNKKTLRFT